MWKEFFYFSKGQRIGILVTLALIIIVFGANFILPLFFKDKPIADNAFLNEALAFKKTLVSSDSIRQAEWERRYKERQLLYENNYAQQSYINLKKDLPVTLFNFDPNTIDSSGFVRLGLKPYIASNILKYRKKGGKFRSVSDFAKVYGISSEKFKQLEPYINIAESKIIKKDTVANQRPVKLDVIVDLNSADTTALMQVRGIGRGIAKAIVRFRRETGGFVSVDQLQEVYGVRSENFDKIRAFCTVNVALVQKIKVNTASVQRLDAHPYINFYQAKAIYEFRRNKGKLKSASELKELTEFTTLQLEKVIPYLSFE